MNFNLIGTILHLFARQSQLLKRKVEVKLNTPYDADMVVSNMMITEVKIHASISYKKKEDSEAVHLIPKPQSPFVRFQSVTTSSSLQQTFPRKSSSEMTERAHKLSEGKIYLFVTLTLIVFTKCSKLINYFL